MGVALESWNVALTTGFLLGRGVKLVFATMLNIGRIDRPFLDLDASRLYYAPKLYFSLDFYPTIFRKALLCVEAHRHPYIERLGMIYLMKIRHKEAFARTSGSCWRLLFVFALMPWLRKYRIAARPELEDDSGQDFDLEKIKWGRMRRLPQRSSRKNTGRNAENVKTDRESMNIEEKVRSLQLENDRLRTQLRDALSKGH